MSLSYDAIIVGAGPGGSAAATVLARAGCRVLLIEKATFPRDKICGDAISGKSVSILHRLQHIEALRKHPHSVGSYGVTFSGPSGAMVHIPFKSTSDEAPGYLIPRVYFDQLMVEGALQAGATLWENTSVTRLLWDKQQVIGVQVRQSKHSFSVHAPLILGADGAYSVVSRELGFTQLSPNHYCAGLRMYVEGVTGCHPDHYIELHFVEEAIPGYFWIFPMAHNQCNVGIGMLSSVLKKQKRSLKVLLQACMSHPHFKHRFKNATLLTSPRGWGLPLGSRPRPMAGNGWMLIGDAASLIDPFTGEGIGNALYSGYLAGEWAIQALHAGLFDRAYLQAYEKEVLQTLQSELRLSRSLQQLTRWKWLLDTVIKRAARSKELAHLISNMFDNLDMRKQLLNPLFYLNILRT